MKYTSNIKKIFYLFAILVSNSLYAQQPNCNCEVALNKLIKKVENEYPGFSAKTKEQVIYNKFKNNLNNEAKKANTLACNQLLKRYTDFFKDPHLWVGVNGSPIAPDQTAAEKIIIDIQDFKNRAQTSKDALEGVWITEGYQIGIKKVNGNEYVGFIIEAKSSAWKPKDIKFRLFSGNKFEYALLDRSKKEGEYQYYDENILFLEEVGVALVKKLPNATTNTAQVEARLKALDGFYFKKISAKTAILKLPSFEYQHVQEIDELIEKNKALLENSENLIIDLRGNPGGTTDAYQKLLPYISGPAIRHTGTEFLASQTYIQNLETYKKSLDKNTSTAGIDQQIKTLKANLGKFVNFNKSGQPVYIEEITPAPKSPKQIVILANKGTGSSAEYFLFIAKQSKKVKLLGRPSYGALDYGNAYLVDFGCPKYQVFMPTYRALRLPDYPIDHIGIQPDVYLDRSVTDWIGFAVKYLEE